MRYLFGFMCVLALGVMGCGETAGTGGSGGTGGVGGGSAGAGGTAGSAGSGGSGGGICDDLEAFECIDEPSCTPLLDSGFRDCIAVTEEECATLSDNAAGEDSQTFCAKWASGIFAFSNETRLCRQDADCPPGDECTGTPLGECQMACVRECGEDVGECPEGETCVWHQPGCGDHSVITGWDWDGITSVCE
jgi:hypothetical protein